MRRAFLLLALTACDRSAAGTGPAVTIELPKLTSGTANPPAPNVIVTIDSVVVSNRVMATIANGALADTGKLEVLKDEITPPLVFAFDKRTTGATVIAVLDTMVMPGEDLMMLGLVTGEPSSQTIEFRVTGTAPGALETNLSPNLELHHEEAVLTAKDGTDKRLGLKAADPIDESVTLTMAVSRYKSAHGDATDDTLTLTLYPDATAADLIMAVESTREQYPHLVIVAPG